MTSTLPASEGDSVPPPRQIVPTTKVWVTLASLVAAIALVRYGWLEVLVGDVIDQWWIDNAQLRMKCILCNTCKILVNDFAFWRHGNTFL